MRNSGRDITPKDPVASSSLERIGASQESLSSAVAEVPPSVEKGSGRNITENVKVKQSRMKRFWNHISPQSSFRLRKEKTEDVQPKKKLKRGNSTRHETEIVEKDMEPEMMEVSKDQVDMKIRSRESSTTTVKSRSRSRSCDKTVTHKEWKQNEKLRPSMEADKEPKPTKEEANLWLLKTLNEIEGRFINKIAKIEIDHQNTVIWLTEEINKDVSTNRALMKIIDKLDEKVKILSEKITLKAETSKLSTPKTKNLGWKYPINLQKGKVI